MHLYNTGQGQGAQRSRVLGKVVLQSLLVETLPSGQQSGSFVSHPVG